jgi:hypothetical protein
VGKTMKWKMAFTVLVLFLGSIAFCICVAITQPAKNEAALCQPQTQCKQLPRCPLSDFFNNRLARPSGPPAFMIEEDPLKEIKK